MLSLFRSQTDAPRLKLYRMTIHVGRGDSAMPANLVGAYVPVFVGAADHESGVEQVVRKLQKQGFEFIDLVDAKVDELDPKKWDEFVRASWPEFADEFPTQKGVLEALKNEFLFIGPFAGYEPQRT